MKVSHCNERGCRELVKQGQRYCQEHAKLHQWTGVGNQKVKHDDNKRYNRLDRDQASNDFYHSKQWQQVRQQVLLQEMYLDSVTGLPAINGERLIVDHIVPLKLLGTNEDRLNPDNLWVLSQHVHSIKSSMEKRMTDNQLKHCTKQWWQRVLQEKVKKR